MNSSTTAENWRAYGIWSLWVGVAFFAVYPTCNWLSAQRAETYRLYFEWELELPLVPEFIWAYLSMYLLFALPAFFLDRPRLIALGRRLVTATLIAGAIFLLFPAQLGFERVLPEAPLYRALYGAIFSVDLPHNMVPSLHIVFSGLILLALMESPTSARLSPLWVGWLLLICGSTVLVHQHHILDALSALVIVEGVRRFIPQGASRNV